MNGYTYDAGHLLRGITYPWKRESISHTYQLNNWLMTPVPGFTTTYTYNPCGYVTDLINQASNGVKASELGSTTVAAQMIAYDTAGNRTGELEVAPAVNSPIQGEAPDLNRTATYTYDKRNELTEEASVSHVTDYYNATYDWLFGYGLADNPTTFRATASTPAM